MQYISKALLTEYLEDTIIKCETVINRSESIHNADDYLTSIPECIVANRSE